MTELRLQTLGGLRLFRDGAEVPKLERHPVRSALLVYLAMEREARRDELVHLLWPDRDERDGRHNLSQTLYGLRQFLGEQWADREGDLVTVGDLVEVDALEFEVAVAEGKWQRALELYGGAFLGNTSLSGSAPFQDWSERRRARLVRLAREAWRTAMVSPRVLADVEAGIRLAREWVRHDPLEDEAQHTLLEQLARAGRRTEVVERYESYERLLRDELELEPLEPTKKLVELVRRGDFEGVESTAVELGTRTTTLGTTETATPVPHEATVPARMPLARTALPWAALATLLALGLLLVPLLSRPPADRTLLSFDLNPPIGVTPTQGLLDAALSPDGSTVLFIGTDTAGRVGLWSRSITAPSTSYLTGTEGAHTPFWSPDGRRFGYYAQKHLWISSLGGDRPQRLVETTYESRGATWSGDDVILYAPDPRSGLRSFSLADGTVREVTTLDAARGEIGHLWPRFLPDGRSFVYFVPSEVDSLQGIYTASLDDPGGRFLTRSSGNALPAGEHLLFYRDGDLFAQPFDARARSLSGRPEPVVTRIAASFTYEAAFSASQRNRVLIYSSDSTKTHSRIELLGTDGSHMGYRTPPQHQRNPDVSPRGGRVAFELYSGTRSNVAVVDLETGGVRRLAEAAQGRNPVWSPDGRRVAYVAEVAAGWQLRVWDLEATDAPLGLHTFDREVTLSQWSEALGVLLYSMDPSGHAETLAIRPVDGALPEVLLAGGPGHRFGARVSPDGRRIAYTADDLGQYQVYVEPLPGARRRCQVSSTGGVEPRWANDRDLFFLDLAGNLLRASVDFGDTCDVSPAAVVARRVTDRVLVANSNYGYDGVAERFVLNRYDVPVAHTISVLVDWPLALDRDRTPH